MATLSCEPDLSELWRLYKDHGDARAREQLVLAYAPLVRYIAARITNGLPSHVEEADIVSYGMLGLISALERFDASRHVKFETYARTRIRGAIIDELRALDWVPRTVRKKAGTIERAHVTLAHRLRRTPTDRETAEQLGMPVHELQECLTRVSNSALVALDDLWHAHDGSGERLTLIDTIQDPNALDPAREIDSREMKASLADAIASLPEREKLVLALYYFECLTLREIGEVLGVTESRVSQLHTKAVLRLKARLGAPSGPVAAGQPCGGHPAEPARPQQRRRRRTPSRAPAVGAV